MSTISASTSATTKPSQTDVVRKLLRERCSTTFKSILSQADDRFRTRNVGNQAEMRTLTAVLELQRLELHSELQDDRIDHDLIASLIYELSTRSYLTDHRALNHPHDQEVHLRLLAAAIRLYKYYGRSLDHQIHQNVHRNLSRSANTMDRGGPDEQFRIEESNVGFLIKHCQHLLLSIDPTDSLGRLISRRGISTMDTHNSVSIEHETQLQTRSLEIHQCQRTRPQWHNEYMQIEDACTSVFASDIRIRGSSNVEAILQETIALTRLLRDSLEVHLPRRQQPHSKLNKVMKRAVNVVANANLSSDATPNPQQVEYLHYGLMDLLYQLSFRCRKRSRVACFTECVQLIRLILERCPPSVGLHLKATDLWNRILDLGDIDHIVYGEQDDREAIDTWIGEHLDATEARDYSTMFFTQEL
jgi:hypothetical protein